MKREQDENWETSYHSPKSTLTPFSRKPLLSYIHLLSAITEQYVSDILYHLAGLIVLIQSSIINSSLAMKYVLRTGSFLQALGPELALVTSTIILLSITYSIYYNSLKSVQTSSSAMLRILMVLLAVLMMFQSTLCTARLLAFSVGMMAKVQVLGVVGGQGWEIAVSCVATVLSFVISVGYTVFIITPMPSSLFISANSLNWLYLFNFLPGFTILLRLIFHPNPGFHRTDTSINCVYIALRALPFATLIGILRTTYFYRKNSQRYLDEACSLAGAMAIIEASIFTFHDYSFSKYTIIAVLAVLVACRLKYRCRASYPSLSPSTFYNTLKIVETACLGIDPLSKGYANILQCYVYSKNKLIQYQLELLLRRVNYGTTNIISNQNVDIAASNLDSGRSNKEQKNMSIDPNSIDPSQNLCHLIVEATFEAFLHKKSAKNNVQQLIYLSFLISHSTSYFKIVHLITRLRESCTSFSHCLYLKKLLVSRMNDFDAYSSGKRRLNYFSLTKYEKSQLRFNCNHTRTKKINSLTDNLNIKSSLTTLYLFDRLLKEISSQSTQMHTFYSGISQSNSEMGQIHNDIRTIFQNYRNASHIFDLVSLHVGRQSVFHLIPYAQYVYLLFNDYSCMRKLLRQYKFTTSNLHYFADEKFRFDGVKESSVVIEASADLSALGKVLYEGGNKSLLRWDKPSLLQTVDEISDSKGQEAQEPATNEKKAAKGSSITLQSSIMNIFELLHPTLQDEHKFLVTSFMNRADKNYLGIRKERLVYIRSAGIFRNATIVVTMGVSLKDGYNFYVGLDFISNNSIFTVLNPTLNVVGVSEGLAAFSPRLPQILQITHNLKSLLLSSQTKNLKAQATIDLNAVPMEERINILLAAATTRREDQLLSTFHQHLDFVKKTEEIDMGTERITMDLGNGRLVSLEPAELNYSSISLSKGSPNYLLVLGISIEVFITSKIPRPSPQIRSGRAGRGNTRLNSNGLAANNLLSPCVQPRLIAPTHPEPVSTSEIQPTHERRLSMSSEVPELKKQRQNEVSANESDGSRAKQDKTVNAQSLDGISSSVMTGKDLAQRALVATTVPWKLITLPSLYLILAAVFDIICTFIICYQLDSVVGQAMNRVIINNIFHRHLIYTYESQLNIFYKLREKMLIRAGIQNTNKFDFLAPGKLVDMDKDVEDAIDVAENYYVGLLHGMNDFDARMYEVVRKYYHVIAIPGNYSSPWILKTKRKITAITLPIEAESQYKILLKRLPYVNFDSTEYILSSIFVSQAVPNTSNKLYNELNYNEMEEFAKKIKSTNLIIIIIFVCTEVLILGIIVACYIIRSNILDIYEVFRVLEDREIDQKSQSLVRLSDYIRTLQHKSIFQTDKDNITIQAGGDLGHQPDGSVMRKKGKTPQINISRNKFRAIKRNQFYFFNLRSVIIVFFLLLHGVLAVMVYSMNLFSSRRQVLNDTLFTVRFIGKSMYLLTVMEHTLNDMMLIRMGLLKYSTIDAQVKRMATMLDGYDESYMLVRNFYNNMPDVASQHFFNLARSGEACTIIDFQKYIGLAPSVCRTMAMGIFALPFLNHFDYFRKLIGDTLTDIKTSTDVNFIRSIFDRKEWKEYQFLVGYMQIYQYKGYMESFLAGVESYQSLDSNQSWQLIYIVNSLTYFVAVQLLIYLLFHLWRHSSVALQSIKILPERAINHNSFVKAKLEFIIKKVNK